MKVLQVSESDNIGGAAVAATRLNGLLKKFGIVTELLVSRNKSNGSFIAPVNFFDKLFATLLPHFIIRYNKWRFGTNALTVYYKRSSSFFTKTIKKRKFDILNLHWVNNGFVGLEDLDGIVQPIVWTLHDTWLFTAGCHSTQGCLQFTESCQVCPKIEGLHFQKNLDKQFEEKLIQLQKLQRKIHIVVPSRWMLNSVRSSKLLKGFNSALIPNFIDTELFLPVNQVQAKHSFGLDENIKYILFGASDPINDSNKGFSFIKEMDACGALNGYTLLIFGNVPDENLINLSIPFIVLNQITDQNRLASLYSAAEMLIMPSIHESFGQVAAEAMSCGIPVLCFDTTGLKDVVDHKENGYLAVLKDVKDLIIGFNWIISQNNLNLPARNKILNEFSKEVIFNKYLSLYSELLNDEDRYA